MKLRPSRRALLLGLAAGAAAPVLPRPASAQEWPAKAIKVVIPFGAGSSADVAPRIVMEQLQSQLGQPVVVENRPGGGGTTGTAVVAKADPDGYTLLSTSSAYSVTPAIYHNLTYDPVKDLVPIVTIGSAPSVLVVAANQPYNTLAEFVAAAKANRGRSTSLPLVSAPPCTWPPSASGSRPATRPRTCPSRAVRKA